MPSEKSGGRERTAASQLELGRKEQAGKLSSTHRQMAVDLLGFSVDDPPSFGQSAGETALDDGLVRNASQLGARRTSAKRKRRLTGLA